MYPSAARSQGAGLEKFHIQRTGRTRRLVRAAASVALYVAKGHWAPKIRIFIAAACLGASIAAGASVPFLLKYAVDALTGTALAIGVAIAFVVAYGAGRVIQQGLAQARDAVFSAVGQRAARLVARRVFERLHELSYRFHTERRTGALHQVIDRGAKAIDFLLRMALFNVIPVVGQASFSAESCCWNTMSGSRSRPSAR